MHLAYVCFGLVEHKCVKFHEILFRRTLAFKT